MIRSGEIRQIYKCGGCGISFSETKNTPPEGLRTPLSVIATVLNALSEGLGINAAVRLFNIGKNSIYRWTERLSCIKHTLLLYSLCHNFIKSEMEGDELYTKILKNTPASESEGRTLVLMERASRFIWAVDCGKKDRKMFERAVRTLLEVIRKSEDITLLTDGERRYGSVLFEICHEPLRTGKRGRPRKVLKKGVKVRIKNRGAQRRPGRKRPKYEAPCPEHPETAQDVEQSDIHAHHAEAFNASLRRKCAAFRRKTNTYAKNAPRLQDRLNLIWIPHNFVRKHYTTGEVPAVALGIVDSGMQLEDLMRSEIVR